MTLINKTFWAILLPTLQQLWQEVHTVKHTNSKLFKAFHSFSKTIQRLSVFWSSTTFHSWPWIQGRRRNPTMLRTDDSYLLLTAGRRSNDAAVREPGERACSTMILCTCTYQHSTVLNQAVTTHSFTTHLSVLLMLLHTSNVYIYIYIYIYIYTRVS